MATPRRYPFTNPFADPGAGRDETVQLIRRVLVGLYFAGGLTMFTVRLLPDPGFRPGAETYHLVLIFFMFGFGAFTWAMPRLPDWWYLLSGALGVVVVSVIVVLLEDLRPVALYYIWPAMGGAFFAQRREAIAVYILVVVTYGVALFGFHSSPFVVEWFVEVATSIAVVMVMLYLLKVRALKLIGELSRRASTDPLTGIANRSTFERALEQQLSRAADEGAACAVISLDLDRFKQVNDIYGHLAGDEALRRAAVVFADCLGDRGTVARIGGEEFAIVMPADDLEEARGVAEELRRSLERRTAAAEPSLTVSVGVAVSPRSGTTLSSLMLAADRALYAAKQAGRNQVVADEERAERLLDLAEQERSIEASAGAQTALRLAEQLDLHRHGEHRRSRQVGDLAGDIAEDLVLSVDAVSRIRLAGMVRDVGMLGVPDELLASSHALTPGEREIVERHVQIGTEVLAACGLPDIAAWVAAHHERPDGNGYPRGLAGEQIPLPARIIAAAEAYSSLTRGPGVAPAVALAELRECAGSQFDETVVEALARVLSQRGELAHLRVA